MMIGFEHGMEITAKALEVTGVAALVVGILVSTAGAARGIRNSGSEIYRSYRNGIGRAILLSLEFLIAADIIRTVAVEPTLHNVGVLAIIVLVRTFLSMTLEVELQGRWPWQRRTMSRG